MNLSLKQTFDNLLKSNRLILDDSYNIEKAQKGKDVFVGISPEGHPAILIII